MREVERGVASNVAREILITKIAHISRLNKKIHFRRLLRRLWRRIYTIRYADA